MGWVIAAALGGLVFGATIGYAVRSLHTGRHRNFRLTIEATHDSGLTEQSAEIERPRE